MRDYGMRCPHCGGRLGKSGFNARAVRGNAEVYGRERVQRWLCTNCGRLTLNPVGLHCPVGHTKVYRKGVVPTRQGQRERYICWICGRTFYSDYNDRPDLRRQENKEEVLVA